MYIRYYSTNYSFFTTLEAGIEGAKKYPSECEWIIPGTFC